MKVEIKIPAVGESITEATISQWTKKDGDFVKRNDVLLILETDKASVEVVAENEGRLTVKTQEGQTVPIGSIVGLVDTEGKADAGKKADTVVKPAEVPAAPPMPIIKSAMPLSPAVRRIVTEQGLNINGTPGTGKNGRLTKGDVLNIPSASPVKISPPNLPPAGFTTTREPMTKLRQTIARRLVEAQSTAAILTTFNEIDMSSVMALRTKYKEKFKEKYNINLGFMGFFIKASIDALKSFPRVNAIIDGTDIVYNHFYNIGVAVGTERGLVVPVIRNAEQLSISEIEKSIKHYAEKAREGKISLDDLTGGTFTISNGGVYGSMMSTPILNPPQSAILGLHKIEDRPVAIQGKVEIRPMMYVALSYDHRIIDGGESVSFLVKIKEGLEDPARLLLDI